MRHLKACLILLIANVCVGVQVKFHPGTETHCLIPMRATNSQEGGHLSSEFCGINRYQVWEIENIDGNDTMIYSLEQINPSAIKVVTFDKSFEYEIYNITTRTISKDEDQLWFLRKKEGGEDQYQIVNKRTGHCIGRRSTSTPLPVNIGPCDDYADIWGMFKMQKEYETVKFEKNEVERLNVSLIYTVTSRCLVQDQDVPVWGDCNRNITSFWEIGTRNAIKNGTTVMTLTSPKMALTQNGTTLFLAELTSDESLNQYWNFPRQSQGYINEVGGRFKSVKTPELCVQDGATFLRTCGSQQGNYNWVFKEAMVY